MEKTTTWEQPPSGLWEQIAGEAGVSAAPEPPAPAPVEAHAGEPTGSPQPQDAPAPIDLAARRTARRSPLPLILGAAAAAAVVVAGLVVVMDRPADPTLVASAPLDRLGPAGSGEAELLDDDGELTLRVDTAGLDAGDGFLEVWVIDPDVTKLVSLGPLRPDGTYDLPEGLDPEQFPVVDVSVEPLDGNPTHSGDSVLRGQLEF
jgi:anti-sigma-K factor RskA